MDEWRPEDWKNPYDNLDFGDWAKSLWEAGADAMLAALRSVGSHLSESEIDSGIEVETRQFEYPSLPGTWVFIPDAPSVVQCKGDCDNR